MRVERVMKGVKGKEVLLRTGVGGGDCGIKFKEREKYLVYAYVRSGELRTNGCTRTKLLKHAVSDFKEIEEGVEVKAKGAETIKSLP